MAFWTLTDVGVTLCEDHALEATNVACHIAGKTEPFSSMSEAVLILSALLSTTGGSLDIESSDEGICLDCPKAGA